MAGIEKSNYVDKAEEVIKGLRIKDKNGKLILTLTTSKIRNILAMVSELYNEVQRQRDTVLSDEMASRVKYLKMRIAYEAGRDEKTVKPFVQKAELMEEIDKIGKSREKLLTFCNYMEALVAYHKYYGGKD